MMGGLAHHYRKRKNGSSSEANSRDQLVVAVLAVAVFLENDRPVIIIALDARLFDLNDEAKIFRMKMSSAIIVR